MIHSFPNNRDEFIGAEEVMRWLHGRTSGVFGAENNARISAVNGVMQVVVSDGIGWLANDKGNGIVWWIDNYESNGINLTIEMADAVLPRIDRVVVSWNTTNYADLPELKVLKGTPAANPVPPELTNNDVVRQISLAAIKVEAGTTGLTDLMITDERLNPDVCGIVSESFKADTAMMFAQYKEAIAQLQNAIAQAWEGEISDGSITSEKLAADVSVAKHWEDVISANLWKPIDEANEAWFLIDFDYLGEDNVYAMAIAADGIRTTDRPIVDVDLSHAATASEAIACRDAWGCIDRCVVHIDDWLVFYCFGDKPTVDVPYVVKVVR